MTDQPKQGELLPTPAQSEVSLAELARAAQPLMDKWSETEIAKGQEETKRLHIELEANKRLDTFDFVIVLVVLVAVFIILAWAMYREHEQIVTHVLASIAGLLGGYGFGRYKAAKQVEE